MIDKFNSRIAELTKAVESCAHNHNLFSGRLLEAKEWLSFLTKESEKVVSDVNEEVVKTSE